MASPLAPAMKAGHLKANLEIARDLAGDAEPAFLAAMGDAMVEEIEGSLKTAWLPIELDMAVSRATCTVLGAHADRERARESTRRSMNTRILAPIVEGVRKVFGMTPKPALKVTRRGWHAIYRNCGQPEFIDLGEGAADLLFEEMPAAALASNNYLFSIAGGLHAILDICRVEGTVEVGEVDPEAKKVRIEFRWTP